MMNKNTLVSIVIGVLLLVALVQFFQISSIDTPTTAVSVETQNTPVKQAPIKEEPAPLPIGVQSVKAGCGI